MGVSFGLVSAAGAFALLLKLNAGDDDAVAAEPGQVQWIGTAEVVRQCSRFVRFTGGLLAAGEDGTDQKEADADPFVAIMAQRQHHEVRRFPATFPTRQQLWHRMECQL